MRAFGGDLGILGLANLLQVITMGGARGFLTISDKELKKTIQFCSQGIRLVSGVRRAVPLGQILVRSGKISPEQLEELLAEQRSSARRLGDLVIENGLVTKEEIDKALGDQVAEEIYELFAWNEARFYFAESESDNLPNGAGPLAAVTLDTNIISLMVEAARRADEIARIRSEIPMDQIVPLRTEVAITFEGMQIAQDTAEEILSLVDGKRSIDQITHESAFPKFTVLTTLHELKQRGFIALDPPHETQLKRPTGPSILVINKDSASRAETAAQLNNGGYNVVEAESWAGAESWLDSVKAVVLETSFETDEALDLCEHLREDSRKPFILVTEGASMDTALQSGARYVLLKPVPEKLLMERLQGLL
jgi:CheY-like chemotaxis protein